MKNRFVRSIEEELKEVGLDPKRTLGEIDRVHGLVEARVKGTGAPPAQPGQGRPSAPSLVESRQLRTPRRSSGALTLAEQARRELAEAGGDPSNIEEAFAAVKKKRKSAAEKLKAKLSRKKNKSRLRKASRMYRKRNKRKIARRMAMKLKKFGKKGLAKLHAMGKRIMMQHADAPGLASLREDLQTFVMNESVDSEKINSYEEAAFNAGVLAMHLGEIFESLGDEASAETLYTLSDAAADLSEDLDRVDEDEVSESQVEKLQKLLGGVVKAMKVYEAVGSPSLFDAIEMGEATAA